MVLAKFWRCCRRSQVNHAENVLNSNQGNAQDMFIQRRRRRSCTEDGTTFPHGSLSPLLADNHLRLGLSVAAPRARRIGLLTCIRLQHNCALFGWDHFENQPQHLALQCVHIVKGVDEVGDLEKCGEVARHSPDA